MGAATACTVNAAGTWNLTGNISLRTIDGTSAEHINSATLIITGSTITSLGIIATATLDMTGYTQQAVTGFIGKGTHPYITLYGTATDIKTIFNGRVTSSSGTASRISGTLTGQVTHSEGVLGTDAAPAAAATWSTAKQYSGTTSVLLTQAAGAGSTYVDVGSCPSGIKLKELDTLTSSSGWGMAHFQSANAYGAQIELKFQKVGCPDPGGVGHVDVTLIPNQAVGSAAWAWENFTSTTPCIYYGNDPYNGTAFSNSTGAVTLAGVEASINAQAAMSADGTVYTCGEWRLTRVRVELWEAGGRTDYIDQLTIKSHVYSFEPVSLSGSLSGTK